MSTDSHIVPVTEKPVEPSSRLFGQEAVSQLTSYEQRDLLDAVDKLRRANISGKDFGIPQVVVCGDQSAGKSSVLEAISQLRFPVGEAKAVTKLATEVVLRNNSLPSVTPVTLTIIADKSRTAEQKAYIESFDFSVNVDEPKAFPDAVHAALEYLKRYEPLAKFWYDRLHVEISGPSQPNLTLVDLPGLIQNESYANPGDKERIKNLVKQYVCEPKTVVLAVVTADQDVANQEVIQLVKDYDAADRTMGVLTKTDRLRSGSVQETAAIRIARNIDVSLSLGLGWHALRNMPDQASQDVSFGHREEVERSFFTKLPWSELDRKDAGIVALREKLSLRLFDLITDDLPNFVGLMESQLEDCSLRHQKLGAARDTPDTQMYHLQHIQRNLQSLIQDALDGRPDRSDFAGFFDGSSHRALRTTINRYSGNFATKMREEGKQYEIFGNSKQRCEQFKAYSPELNKPNFYPPYKPTGVWREPSNISLEGYCQILAAFIKDTRGTCLQGFQAPGTQTAIFRQQSVYWGLISKEYVGDCYTAVSGFLKCAVMHIAGRHTGEKLMQAFIDRSLSELGSKLEEKLNELLWPYQNSHPSTQNPNYIARVSLAKETHRSQVDKDSEDDEDRNDTDASWAEIASNLKHGHELVDAARALDLTDAYYDVALDTFIDNVTILGVEAILLDKIKDLLSYKDVAQLRGDRLSEIAAEPPGAQQERDDLKRQISVLIEVIKTCKKYKHPSSSYSSSLLPVMERAVEGKMGTTSKPPSAAKQNGLDSQPAPGPQPAKSTTTSNGLFRTSPVPNPTTSTHSPLGGGLFAGQRGSVASTSTQSLSGGGLFGGRPSQGPMPIGSGAKPLFRSPSTPSDSDGSS